MSYEPTIIIKKKDLDKNQAKIAKGANNMRYPEAQRAYAALVKAIELPAIILKSWPLC